MKLVAMIDRYGLPVLVNAEQVASVSPHTTDRDPAGPACWIGLAGGRSSLLVLGTPDEVRAKLEAPAGIERATIVERYQTARRKLEAANDEFARWERRRESIALSRSRAAAMTDSEHRQAVAAERRAGELWDELTAIETAHPWLKDGEA